MKLDEARSTLLLEGEVGIRSAKELKQALVQALEAANEIAVSLEKATELDVTAVQLLWTAKREALEAGLEFVYIGTEPEEIAIALAEAGLELFTPVPEAK